MSRPPVEPVEPVERPERPERPEPVGAAARRYGRLLHAYPPVWRREHGAVLLGTLLDVDDARGGTGPTAGEARDLVVQGVRTRLGLLAPQRRTRELASTLALVVGTATALSCLVVGEWLFVEAGSRAWRGGSGLGWPFATAAPVLYLLWPLALAAVVAGRPRWARWLLVLCAPVGLAVLAMSALWHLPTPPAWPALALVTLGPLAALGVRRWSGRQAVAVLLAVGALTDALILDLLQLLRTDSRWARGSSPLSPADDFGFGLQLGLWVDVQTGLIVLVLLAVVALPWRRHWLPAVILVASAWMSVFGPVGLLLSLEYRLAEWMGLPLNADVSSGTWLSSVATCVVLTFLLVVLRWRRGSPGRRSWPRES